MSRRDAHQHGTIYPCLTAAHVHTWIKTARPYKPVRLSCLFHTSKIQIRLPPSLPPSIYPSLPLSVSLHAFFFCCLVSLSPPSSRLPSLFLALPFSRRCVRKGNSNVYSINHASTPRMLGPLPQPPCPLVCARASPANTSASRLLHPRRQPDGRNLNSLDNYSVTLIPKPQDTQGGTAATPSHCRQSASTACSSCVHDGYWSSGASVKKGDHEYMDGGSGVPHLRAPRSLPEP